MSAEDDEPEPVHVWATDLTEQFFHADVDREPGADNMQIGGFDVQPKVFFISLGLILLFIIFIDLIDLLFHKLFDKVCNRGFRIV